MPQGASACHQIWSYYIKPNGEYKARDCLNGNKLTSLYNNTFNICVTWIPAALTFFAICAVNNFFKRSYDIVNAFMEADPPCENLFVVVDQQLSDYYNELLRK